MIWRRWWGHRHLHRWPSVLLLLLHHRGWRWSPKLWLSSHSHWWRDRHGMGWSLWWWRRHVWRRWPELLKWWWNDGSWHHLTWLLHHLTLLLHHLTWLLRLTLPGWWLARHLHRGESHPLWWRRTYCRNRVGRHCTICKGARWHRSSHRAIRLCNL